MSLLFEAASYLRRRRRFLRLGAASGSINVAEPPSVAKTCFLFHVLQLLPLPTWPSLSKTSVSGKFLRNEGLQSICHCQRSGPWALNIYLGLFMESSHDYHSFDIIGLRSADRAVFKAFLRQWLRSHACVQNECISNLSLDNLIGVHVNTLIRQVVQHLPFSQLPPYATMPPSDPLSIGRHKRSVCK